MSSSVYIPSTSGGGSFTPPASISVKTASYTIPAGRYARVYTECDSGGIFTINGVNSVVTAAFVNIDVAPTINASYTVPTGFKAELNVAASDSTGSFVINGNHGENFTGTSYSKVYPIGPSGTVVGSGGLNTKSFQGVATPSNATNRQATFYVPTGTVISGSGNWKAVVEEYTI